MAQWIEYLPANWKVTSSIPCQGTCPGCRPGPQLGVCERQPHIDVCLTHWCFFAFLCPSSPLSLPINKIFKKKWCQRISKIWCMCIPFYHLYFKMSCTYSYICPCTRKAGRLPKKLIAMVPSREGKKRLGGNGGSLVWILYMPNAYVIYSNYLKIKMFAIYTNCGY